MAIWSALANQTGAILVHTIEELVDTMKGLYTCRR